MFHAEINRTLTASVNLINTAEGLHSATSTPDRLTSIESLRKFLTAQDSELAWPSSTIDRAQVDQVRELRGTLHEIWSAAPITSEEPVEKINTLLEGVGTRVVRASHSKDPEFRSEPIPVSGKLADVMTASIADALQYLIIHDETGRMRTCRGDECDAVIVDLTRNRSKLFCDFGNCANRAHVRAYRARQAALRDAGRRALAGERVTAESSDRQTPTQDRLAKPSAAEKAAQLNEPTSESAAAAKEFRGRMRDELMEQREKKEKKARKKGKKSKR